MLRVCYARSSPFLRLYKYDDYKKSTGYVRRGDILGEGGRKKGRKRQLKMSVQDVRAGRRKGGEEGGKIKVSVHNVKDGGMEEEEEGRGGRGEGGKERRKGSMEEVMGKPAQ